MLQTYGGQTHECFAECMKLTWRIEKDMHQVAAVLTRKSESRQGIFSNPKDAEGYLGGMYRSIPMHSILFDVWLYPPHVVIPSANRRVQ